MAYTPCVSLVLAIISVISALYLIFNLIAEAMYIVYFERGNFGVVFDSWWYSYCHFDAAAVLCGALIYLIRSSYTHFHGPRVLDWAMSELNVPGFLDAKDATIDSAKNAHSLQRFHKELFIVFGSLATAELLLTLDVLVWRSSSSSSNAALLARTFVLTVGIVFFRIRCRCGLHVLLVP